MTTKTFDKEYLVEELDLPFSCIDQEITHQGRWETYKTGIAEIDGEFYRFEWSEGSTEMQDGMAWEYDDEVEGTLVEKRMIEVEAWVEV